MAALTSVPDHLQRVEATNKIRCARKLRIVAFCGTTWRPARAYRLVETAADKLHAMFGIEAQIVDMVDVVPDLCTTTPANLGPRASSLIADLQSADGLIIGCPVFQGSFPGLFKHVFDMLEPGALRDRPVLLTAAGGGLRHSLMVEHQLRPLFGFFEARTVPTAIYASACELEPHTPLPPALSARIEEAVRQFANQLQNVTASAAPQGRKGHEASVAGGLRSPKRDRQRR